MRTNKNWALIKEDHSNIWATSIGPCPDIMGGSGKEEETSREAPRNFPLKLIENQQPNQTDGEAKLLGKSREIDFVFVVNKAR